MTKERYVVHYTENAVKIVQTQVSSVRKKDILRTIDSTIRWQVNGGLAVRLESVMKELVAKAKESLKLAIPYPYEASRELVKNATSQISRAKKNCLKLQKRFSRN